MGVKGKIIMKRYEVSIRETEIYIVKVKANSKADAIDKAWEKLDSPDKDNYHSNSDGESEAVELYR